MRIAFCLDARAVRLPIEASNLWHSARGLTGSELAVFMYAKHLAQRGHDVSVYTKFAFNDEGPDEPFSCISYEAWEKGHWSLPWDAVVASTMATPLMRAPDTAFRMLHQQCNDAFTGSARGWEKHCDLVAPLSHAHARVLAPATSFPRERWRVLHNGVETATFTPGAKTPGKVIWASSLDRGAHWLLEAWPRIKARAPHATLDLFYDMHSIHYMARHCNPETNPEPLSWDNIELGRRSRYILDALRRLERLGVTCHGAVSRARIVEEMRTAEVLAYPLDPVYFTETFGVTVLEACAAGAVPVLCAADAFGELFGACAEAVPPPFSKHKDEWTALVVKCLNNDEHRARASARCVEHAKRFEWRALTDGLEQCLVTRGARGLSLVDWTDNTRAHDEAAQ